MSRRAAAVALGVVAGAAVALPAVAEPLGVGWEGSFTDARLVDGYEATGAELVVPVTFEFRGGPGSVITDVTLDLTPTGGDCDSLSFTQALQSGDGAGAAPGPTSPTPPPPSPDAASATATWTFRVDPRCNGVYDLEVVARADPAGSLEPGDPGTESQPLQLSGVEVSLAAPSPTGVNATVRGDRTVEVRWAPPSGWAGGAPPDAYGYRVVRAAGSGAPVTVADDLTLSTSSIVDDSAATAPPGRYRYAVIAMRKDASGNFLLSPPAETTLDVGPPPAAVPAASTAPRSTNLGGGVRVGSGAGVAVTAPSAPTIPDTFETEIDYSDLESGPEQAIVPDDASLFEVVTEDPVGAGLLVPAAIALCLAVWAGHLRHLAHRATPGSR